MSGYSRKIKRARKKQKMKDEQRNNPFSLKKAEILAIQGVQLQEQQIQERYISPLKLEWKELMQEICERLQLPKDSIGTTHIIDIQRNAVVEIPVTPSPVEIPTEALVEAAGNAAPAEFKAEDGIAEVEVDEA